MDAEEKQNRMIINQEVTNDSFSMVSFYFE
jgi:hypothetical protein